MISIKKEQLVYDAFVRVKYVSNAMSSVKKGLCLFDLTQHELSVANTNWWKSIGDCFLPETESGNVDKSTNLMMTERNIRGRRKHGP